MGSFYTKKTVGDAAAGLTATQVILLRQALAGPIKMLAGDRLGTRCVGHEESTGAALMVAYGSPEFFLRHRGLIKPRNERHLYDITDAGREAIGKALDLIAKRNGVQSTNPRSDT